MKVEHTLLAMLVVQALGLCVSISSHLAVLRSRALAKAFEIQKQVLTDNYMSVLNELKNVRRENQTLQDRLLSLPGRGD